MYVYVWISIILRTLLEFLWWTSATRFFGFAYQKTFVIRLVFFTFSRNDDLNTGILGCKFIPSNKSNIQLKRVKRQ